MNMPFISSSDAKNAYFMSVEQNSVIQGHLALLFEKVNFEEKNSRRQQKHENYPTCKEISKNLQFLNLIPYHMYPNPTFYCHCV